MDVGTAYRNNPCIDTVNYHFPLALHLQLLCHWPLLNLVLLSIISYFVQILYIHIFYIYLCSGG